MLSFNNTFLVVFFVLTSSVSLRAHELQDAILEGKEERIRDLVDNKGFKDRINELSYLQRTPLYAALEGKRLNRFSIAAFLLERGANINAKNDKDLETVLHLAIRTKDAKLLEFALNNGADPNIQDKNGKTPLHLAAIANDLKVAKQLIQTGARGNIRDAEARYMPGFRPIAGKAAVDYVADKTSELYPLLLNLRFPLHYAVINRDISSLEKLLSTGAYQVNEKNIDSKTPLFLAISPFDLESARVLVQNGADVNDISLLKRIIDNDDVDALKFLAENNASLDGELLLHALKEEKSNSARYLIAQGVMLRPEKAIKDTPLYHKYLKYLQERTTPFPIANIAIFLDDTQEEDAAKEGEMETIALVQEIAKALEQQQLIIASSSIISAIFHVAESNQPAYQDIANEGIKTLSQFKSYQNRDGTLTIFLPLSNPLMPNAELNHLGFNEAELTFIEPHDLKQKVHGDYDRTFKLANLTSLFRLSHKPLKNIILTGHGDQKHSVAHLSFDDYEKLLRFFNDIGTIFLYVSTCYGGGVNLVLANKNLVTALDDREAKNKFEVNFPVAVGSITDSPSKADVSQIWFDGPFSGLNNYFFTRRKTDADKAIHHPKSFVSILKHFNPKFLESTTQIRFPHTRGYFDVVDVENKLKILSYPKLLDIELSAKAKNDRPKIVIEKNIKAILLYPGIIKIPIHLAEKFPEYFAGVISMIPGNALHYIEELKIDTFIEKNIEKVMRSIFADVTPGRASVKAFLIKNLVFNSENLGSLIVTTSHHEDNLAIRLYSFNEQDYKYLQERNYDFDKNGFVDQPNVELLHILKMLASNVPNNDVLFQSSGGRETKANYKRIFPLFFPFKAIIDSMIENNQIKELEAIFDLAIEENWQEVINLFTEHSSFKHYFQKKFQKGIKKRASHVEPL